MSQTLQELLLLSAAIAVGFLFAVAYYESLCERDVIVHRLRGAARRAGVGPWVVRGVYAAGAYVAVPLLVVVWTQVLEIALIVVGSADRVGSVALMATAIVAATRILGYIRQATSHELAKAIPLSLAFILLTGGTSNFNANIAALAGREDVLNLTTEMILFLVGLEIGLRLLTDTSHLVLSEVRRRRGIESDAGVWRTIWAAVRAPLSSHPTDQGAG